MAKLAEAPAPVAAQTDDERDLDALIGDLRSLPSEGVKIVLYDIVEGGHESLGSFPISVFAEDFVGKKFGAGSYYWRAKDGANRWMASTATAPCRGKFILSSAAYEPREAVLARRYAPPVAPAAAAPQADGGFTARDFLAMMQAQAAQAAAAADRQNQMLMTLLTAVISRPAGPDPIEALARLHEVTKPAAPVESGLSHVREVLALAKELAPAAEGGGSEMQAIAQMVTGAAPMLAPIIGRMFSQRPPAPRPLPVEAQPVTAAVAVVDPAPAAPEIPEGEMWKLKLMQYIQSLVPLAVANKNPGAYVPAFFDQLSDLGIPLPQIRAAIFAPEIVSQLAGVIPEISANRQWFDEFISIVREEWDEAVGDLTDPPPMADNAPRDSIPKK